MAIVTPEQLGKLLHEEFAKDNWGDIDPFYFNKPPKKDDGTEMDGLYEVLKRVCNRLNILDIPHPHHKVYKNKNE